MSMLYLFCLKVGGGKMENYVETSIEAYFDGSKCSLHGSSYISRKLIVCMHMIAAIEARGEASTENSTASSAQVIGWMHLHHKNEKQQHFLTSQVHSQQSPAS